MENEEIETATQKNSKTSEFSKTQTYLGKQNKGKSESKYIGPSVKLPKLSKLTEPYDFCSNDKYFFVGTWSNSL